MTLEELYKKGTGELDRALIENPSVDAFYLLEYAAGLNRTKYLMYKDQPVSEANVSQYMELIRRRAERIPYQYITGTAEFAGLSFEVNPSVLIPRLDTEVLFEQTLKKLKFRSYVLDLCTGSGALGIALKRYRPDIHMVMSDISDEALEIAARNAGHNHLGVLRDAGKQRNAAGYSEYVKEADLQEPADPEAGYDLDFNVRLIKSDLFDDMTADRDSCRERAGSFTGKFDLIVSNPPYVAEDEYEELMPEVRLHEPKLALTAGKDGLDCYRRIAQNAPAFLKEDGVLMLEIGCSQARAVSGLLSEKGFSDINVITDLAGLDRVISCTLKGKSV